MFLSYSRKDPAFVESLVEALTPRGLEPWVDLEGIPPTAEWLDEIYTAIDNADAFVSERGSPGSLRFVEAIDDDALIAMACRRLDRNLDGLEWIRYLARYPYRRTCDNLPLPELLLVDQRSAAAGTASEVEGSDGGRR